MASVAALLRWGFAWARSIMRGRARASAQGESRLVWFTLQQGDWAATWSGGDAYGESFAIWSARVVDCEVVYTNRSVNLALLLHSINEQNADSIHYHRFDGALWLHSARDGIKSEVDDKNFDFPKIDRAALSVKNLLDEDGDKAYWRSCTPEQRIQHIEILRRINYGHRATIRLQRVLEIAQREGG